MRITNNIMSMNTHRFYTNNNNLVSKSAEKLSSGFRINRAGDDAAGLAISEKMRAQIRGMKMAKKNSQDAISLVQTAEGALQSAQTMLQRMKELAIQASTGTNDDGVDRAALDSEFQNLISEIDQIKSGVTFNNMQIFGGGSTSGSGDDDTPAATPTIEMGGSITAIAKNGGGASGIDTISSTVTSDTLKAALGKATTVTEAATGKSFSAAVSGDKINILYDNKIIASASTDGLAGNKDAAKELDFGDAGKVTVKGDGADATAENIAKALNESIKTVTADYTPAASGGSKSRSGSGSGSSASATVTGNAAAITNANSFKDVDASGISATNLKAAIEAATTLTEDVAEGKKFTAAVDGSNIVIKFDGKVIGSAAASGLTGSKDAEKTLDFGNGLTLKVSGKDSTTDATASDVATALNTALANVTGKYTVATSDDGDSGDDSGSSSGGGGSFTIQVGANASDTLDISINDLSSTYLGINGLDITSKTNASTAIDTITTAINTISSDRASLGAMQNRLEYKIEQLANTTENLSAAESRIRDVDIAEEMTQFTKNNILSQAATAMLAQANSLPQNVLSLLR